MERKTLYKGNHGIDVCFREFREEDAPGFVECIRDEYGETYLKRNYYHPEFLIHEHHSAHCKFLVAEVEGSVVATLALKRPFPGESACEFGNAIVKKKYRQYGIMSQLIQYAIAEAKKQGGFSSLYAFVVAYQNISQRSLERVGFRPCGFLLSTLSMEFFSHSFARDGNAKQHLGIMVRREGQQDAGTVYVPAEHRERILEAYRSLGSSVRIGAEFFPLAGKSSCSAEYDTGQQSGTIWVEEAGEELEDCIREIEAGYSLPNWTFNVQLNISDKKAVAAYRELQKLGYFFAGVRPLCGSREIMILHHPRDVQIDFDTMALSEGFAHWRDYVRQTAERLNRNGENGHQETGIVTDSIL